MGFEGSVSLSYSLFAVWAVVVVVAVALATAICWVTRGWRSDGAAEPEEKREPPSKGFLPVDRFLSSSTVTRSALEMVQDSKELTVYARFDHILN